MQHTFDKQTVLENNIQAHSDTQKIGTEVEIIWNKSGDYVDGDDNNVNTKIDNGNNVDKDNFKNRIWSSDNNNKKMIMVLTNNNKNKHNRLWYK